MSLRMPIIFKYKKINNNKISGSINLKKLMKNKTQSLKFRNLSVIKEKLKLNLGIGDSYLSDIF